VTFSFLFEYFFSFCLYATKKSARDYSPPPPSAIGFETGTGEMPMIVTVLKVPLLPPYYLYFDYANILFAILRMQN